MKAKDIQKEIGAISVIISTEIFEKLYEIFKSRGAGGFIDVSYEIANWAIEFEKKHRKTNWEDLLETGLKPISKAFQEKNYEIICWDDTILDFANFKLEQIGE
jgi:hypothetical protein